MERNLGKILEKFPQLDIGRNGEVGVEATAAGPIRRAPRSRPRVVPYPRSFEPADQCRLMRTAVRTQDLEAVRQLVSYGVGWDWLTDRDNNNVFHYLMELVKPDRDAACLDVIRFLWSQDEVRARRLLGQPNIGGKDPLYYASLSGVKETMMFIIQNVFLNDNPKFEDYKNLSGDEDFFGHPTILLNLLKAIGKEGDAEYYMDLIRFLVETCRDLVKPIDDERKNDPLAVAIEYDQKCVVEYLMPLRSGDNGNGIADGNVTS